ncbi:MAG: hypothetical protein LC808_25680 [Actinobacteria bacterium]|nr:hypothetical protein [Actinomycetota bacterium]
MSTPGQSLADVWAAQVQAQYGPESAEALRAVVAGLVANRTVPPLDDLRSELRPLFPAQESGIPGRPVRARPVGRCGRAA